MAKGDWDTINWIEVWGTIAMSAGIGLVRLMYLLRKGRRFKWFDLVLEPCLAVIGGMMLWALAEYQTLPDVLQAVMTSVGAWAGPRSIHYVELKFLGGSRQTDAKNF